MQINDKKNRIFCIYASFFVILHRKIVFNTMSKVLLISTGGTITMVRDKVSGALVPADIETFKAYMPELFAGTIKVEIEAFSPLLDSSDVNPAGWLHMAQMVYDHYEEYDGFVILHGTDTMSYSASALSFMLENLSKPVVFTGSQLPVGVLRSDAKENLLTAIEIAAAKDEEGTAIVPEVTIYFEDRLFRAGAKPSTGFRRRQHSPLRADDLVIHGVFYRFFFHIANRDFGGDHRQSPGYYVSGRAYSIFYFYIHFMFLLR